MGGGDGLMGTVESQRLISTDLLLAATIKYTVKQNTYLNLQIIMLLQNKDQSIISTGPESKRLISTDLLLAAKPP